jgi:hypothetical protein
MPLSLFFMSLRAYSTVLRRLELSESDMGVRETLHPDCACHAARAWAKRLWVEGIASTEVESRLRDLGARLVYSCFR